MTLKLKVKVTKVFVALPIYTHILNLKGLTKIFFKLSCPKGNLCGGSGDGVTVLNPKYPRLSSGDTITGQCLVVNIMVRVQLTVVLDNASCNMTYIKCLL